MNDLSKFGVEDEVLNDDGKLIECSLAGRAFLSLGAELFAIEPELRSVRLVAIQPYCDELAACPQVARIHVLSLRGNRLGDESLKLLLSSRHFLALRTLDLRANNLSEAMLADVRAWAGGRCAILA